MDRGDGEQSSSGAQRGNSGKGEQGAGGSSEKDEWKQKARR